MQNDIQQFEQLQSLSAYTGYPKTSRIVGAAREWLGTPFKHQGRVKGVGVDCAGLAVGVARELGYPVKDRQGYSRLPNGNEMESILDSQCEVSKSIQVGSILFMPHMRTLHIAIVTQLNPTYIIHAYQPNGKVVEHRLDSKWKKRIKKIYQWPH